MKVRLFFLFFILTIGMVYAIEGGETTKIFESDCKGQIQVNVSGILNIDNEEFILRDCIKHTQSNWTCECPVIWMDTKINTINEYRFDISYQYERESVPQSGGSGGGRRYIYLENTTTIEVPVNDTRIVYENQTIETIRYITINVTNNETQEPIFQDRVKPYIVGLILGLMFGISMMVVYYFSKGDEREKRGK